MVESEESGFILEKRLFWWLFLYQPLVITYYCHGVRCRGAGVQAEVAGGIQINTKIRIYFKHTGRKTGFHQVTSNIDRQRQTE